MEFIYKPASVRIGIHWRVIHRVQALQAARISTEDLEVSIVIKDHRIPCIEEIKKNLLTILTTDIY